jgi:uncharacterized protein DUF3592
MHIFELLVSAIGAYNQVGMFLGALACLGIGGLLLGNALYWRVHALRASGTIIGVISSNGMYAPVYRYMLPDGQTHEAKSDVSTGSLSGYKTGTVVPILVSAHNPTEARTANNYLFDVLGLVLIAPGLWFGYTALTKYPITPMTWFMAAAMLLYLAERARAIVVPKGQRLSIEEWKKQHGMAGSINLADVKPIEQLQPSASATPPLRDQLQKNKLAMPTVALFAVIAASIAVYQGISISRLEASGLRADGEVVDLKEESSHNGYVYYPIVKFQPREDMAIEFKDRVGSDPPSYQPGDKVRVLFLANDLRSAIVDRGVWNWTMPAILAVVAVLLSWLFLFMINARREPTVAALATREAG